jgi:hypothetical protein
MNTLRFTRPLLAILFAALAGYAHAAPRVAGRVIRVVGDVLLIDLKNTQKKLIVGDAFSEGDVIATGPSGRAKLLMSEGNNEVVLGAHTRLVIERVGSQARSSASGTTLSLREGQIRSVVKKKYTGLDGDVFEVKTPNAVAGVRGTVFLVGFDPKTFRSLLATEEGAVVWRSQGKELLVSEGKFSTVIGNQVLPATMIDSSPDVSSDVKDMKSEAPRDSEGVSVEDMGSDSAGVTTGFDADGNEVVLEKAPESGGRAPASVGVEAVDSSTSASGGRVSMGGEEQRLALTNVSTAPAPIGVTVAPVASDLQRSQQGLQDQADFVKKNSTTLNPASVSIPIE